MEDALKLLLDVEQQAEKLVKQGLDQREAIKQKAIADANAAIDQFNARLPELQQGFLDRATEQAEQSIAELRLHYDEHNKQLRALAEKHQDEALHKAMDYLLNGDG